MIFEELPSTPTAEELLDSAFSRAARAGRSKGGRSAQQSMIQTATNILSDNLEHVVTEWPDFDAMDPFYFEIASALVDVDDLRQGLSHVHWASRQIERIGRDAQRDLPSELKAARRHRKQTFARLASIVREVESDLELIDAAHQSLRRLPEIDPNRPTIVVAGHPNVGKSSLVNAVTNARNEIAEYPFTTTGIQIGHFDRDYIRYQIIDTPGLLDRPPAERNEIESQTVSALRHVADSIVFLIDASEACGYPIEDQLDLQSTIRREFPGIPIITVCNKSDRSRAVDADYYMSITEDENVEAVLDAAVSAIDVEPDLPRTE